MSPGEHEAGRLYDAYGASLYRYAAMILGNREAAEDVIQQVFLALVGRRGGAIDDAERYLRRAVRNACYAALRRRKVRGGTAPDDDLLEMAAAGGTAISAEERIALGDAIRRLPAEQREVVHLHAFEGRTFADVAGIVGEPINTVASRYRYALEKLKSILSKKAL